MPGRLSRRSAMVVSVIVLLAVTAQPAWSYPPPGRTERVSRSPEAADWFERSIAPSIGAGGRMVAFQSASPDLVPGDTNGTWDIFVHDRGTGVTRRVSVASDGAEGNGLSVRAVIDGGGRYVAYQSVATNLVPDDTNETADIFVHDLETGATERVSLASGGAEASGPSSSAVISAGGRHVSFMSLAPDLVPGDTNGDWDVFVHDRLTKTTRRVSVSSDGAEATGSSSGPSISADGSRVAFSSSASDLVPGDTNNLRDGFVRDLEAGTTERVSLSVDGAEADRESWSAGISADGAHVAFWTYATNLVPQQTARCVVQSCWDVYVRDLGRATTERVSVASDGAEADGSSSIPVLSADGRYVAFQSSAANLVPDDTNQTLDVFVHDRTTGATERVSVSSDGAEPDAGPDSPFIGITPDGRSVAFDSSASGLAPGDTNRSPDIFVRDLGPATGILDMAAQGATTAVTVSGSARFSGTTTSEATDPLDDGVDTLGAEITGASVVRRPEQDDLLLRLRMASVAAVPGVMYVWSFSHGGTSYEVRALRIEGAGLPGARQYFGLYRCDSQCEEIARLPGTIGTTGNEMRVSLPPTVLEGTGAVLTEVAVSAALGEAAPGAVVVLDEVQLPDAEIPEPRIDLAVVPVSAQEEDVNYGTSVPVDGGSFSGAIEGPFPAGDHRVWARACLGSVCGSHARDITI